MKILHLPRSIGANAYNLSIGEKKNGEDSTVLICDPDIYSDKSDILLHISKKNKLSYPFFALEAIWFCLFKAGKYDVMHYNFGTTLFNLKSKLFFGLDLRWFRLRKKVIAVTFQGSDARQADYCVENYDISCYSQEDALAQKREDRIKRLRISFFEKYADLIYTTNADLMNVLPERAKFRPYTKLQPEQWKPCYSDYSKKETVILHAPTKKNIKGTKYVDEAVQRLKAEGYPIEYLMLQDIPNAEVIEYYKKADLVIDQLLIGWYGGFAVECMALGKPVMCYIRESDMRHIPEDMNRDMAIIRVTKDNLYEQIKYYLDHKEELGNIARKSRQYVEKWHDPEKIAKDIIEDYKNAMENKK